MAVVLVDGQTAFAPQARHITCYGALEVEIAEGGPRFTAHHRSTVLDAERHDLLDRLAALSNGCHVVLGSSQALETFWDRRHILRDGLAFLDAIAADGAAEPANLSLIDVHQSETVALASAFHLPDCTETDLLQKARYALVRAQLTWLAYVAARIKGSEARSLLAAFRAWQAIERAKPFIF